MRAMAKVGAVGLLIAALACAAPREADHQWPRIAELARENVRLAAEVDALAGSIRHLSRSPHDLLPVAHDPPTIAAHVLEARHSFDRVVLDRGCRDGVAVGLVLAVRGGARFKGEVYVTDVQGETCSALILREWSPIERGDDATSDAPQGSALPANASSARQVAELERVNAELRQRVASLTMELRTATRATGDGVTIIDVEFPKIDASVLAVKRAENAVVLDKGNRDGVAPGFVFDVYLGRTYKGLVRITEAQETTCSGMILSERSPIATGDAATTGL